MPELPEVEILARYLGPVLSGRVIQQAEVLYPRSIRPWTPKRWISNLVGCRILSVERRAKFLVFRLHSPSSNPGSETLLLGHLGMTGRMYVQSLKDPLPKHTMLWWDLRQDRFVYEDVRRFGRMSFDTEALSELGPEPLSKEFPFQIFQEKLRGSKQSIKIRLLDQSLLAGLGNIYASEALHIAGISPFRSSQSVAGDDSSLRALVQSIRSVLQKAIRVGERLPLEWNPGARSNGVFYYGTQGVESDPSVLERFQVYDRFGLPCRRCRTPIQRAVQGQRSTFYCPQCQSA